MIDRLLRQKTATDSAAIGFEFKVDETKYIMVQPALVVNSKQVT